MPKKNKTPMNFTLSRNLQSRIQIGIHTKGEVFLGHIETSKLVFVLPTMQIRLK